MIINLHLSSEIQFESGDIAPLTHKYLNGFIQTGCLGLIKNLQTDLGLLELDGQFMPVTINETGYDNAYVCSPYTAFIAYAKEELHHLSMPLVEKILKRFIDALASILKKAEINRVVAVNNWMLSTNIYPPWPAEGLPDLTRFLCGRFPDHYLVFRSLNSFLLFRISRSRLGYDVHIAYLASAVLVTIGISSTTWNIVLPAATFLCHLASQRWSVRTLRFPHLSAWLAMIFASLCWYIAANIWDLHTVYSFNITFACLGCGLLWLCVKKRWLVLLGSTGLFVLVHAEWVNRHSYTPVSAEGFGATAGALLVTALVVHLGQTWFQQDRFKRLTVLALAIGLSLLPIGQP